MNEVARLSTEILGAGSRHVFGITGGGSSLVLCDHLEQAGIHVVRTHFEGSAAIMAGTVGRITGTPGVALTIKGPGVANLLPGLAVCHFEGCLSTGIASLTGT